MVDRATDLEAQLAAVRAELSESRREFDIVEGALDFWHNEFNVVDEKLCQLDSADSDAAFWKEESKRKQDLLDIARADLKLAQTVIREYNQYYDRKEGLNL